MPLGKIAFGVHLVSKSLVAGTDSIRALCQSYQSHFSGRPAHSAFAVGEGAEFLYAKRPRTEGRPTG
jgi:hypothetical protein